MRVRTRFAPSPTGPLHMGGVRTALYNYLFAKKNGGDFLLRIEDTDQSRYVTGAEAYITDALEWCGIIADEGVASGGSHAPYRQSERSHAGIYRMYAEQLVESGHAYYAFDTPEALESMRNRLIAAGNVAPQYNYEVRETMDTSLKGGDSLARVQGGEPHVIRLKVPANEDISFTDLIRGQVTFNSSQVDDKVLIKSDGMPTYHLAHIVDDILMEITHAIRGEEWLPSAPAHILIYKFMGWTGKMPQYVHLPLLLKPDGNGKLSKRDGDRLGFPVFPLEWRDPATGEISSGYREQGYYPEAFVNMIALLGWNPGTEQEIFSMDELISAFSFEHVHKGGAKIDPEKTKWFNEQYLRKQDNRELAGRLRPIIREKFNITDEDIRNSDAYLEGAIKLLKDRVQFETEFSEKGSYLFVAPGNYDEQVIAKKWKPSLVPFFNELLEVFSGSPTFVSGDADALIKATAAKHSIKPSEIMQLLRVFISGQGGGVDLLGMMELMGRQEVTSRLKRALEVQQVS